MTFREIPLWKQAPFIRYIIPLMIGIIIQWDFPLPLAALLTGVGFCILIISILNYKKIATRFNFYYVFGISIHLLLFFMGCLLTFFKNVRNDKEWFAKHLAQTSSLLITVEESPSEKPKSFKVLASVDYIVVNDSLKKTTGKIILYIKKDSAAKCITYGTKLLVNARTSPISNPPNTTFDYKKYCALQNIYHQAYITPDQFIILKEKGKNVVMGFLFGLRENILSILRAYIKGEKELGLAEALMIGYKDDLDKQLMKSYSNTGVVHIIAISGLHVGLIYSILLLVINPFTKKKYTKWLRPIILLAGLWGFSLLAGGGPSVLRSAVMFSGIVIGNSMRRKASVYNSLGASALLLLCYNPLWVYDVGFQLSYIAVLSIVIFMKPIYNICYVQNKLLDIVWKMAAVTIAAQILTTPVCLYYFHQFPNLFLITNMIAVPLSSLVLIGELLVCAFCFIPFMAKYVGNLTEWLIKLMNGFIEYMEKMPFALTEGITVSIYQVVVLYLIIIIIASRRIRQFS